MISKPPGWGFHAAVVATTMVIAWWVSIPFGYAEAGLPVIFVLVPLVWYWVVRLIVALTLDRTAVWRRFLGWLPLPLIVLGLWAAVDADLPFRTRFALSQASMERYSQNLLDGAAQDAPDCAWAGLFPVCGRILDEDEGDLFGVELQISDWPIAGTRCFVWSVRGRPQADDYEYGLRHLTGPWWGCRGWDGW